MSPHPSQSTEWSAMLLIACAILAGVAGCGGDQKEVPVSGQVTIDGKPLTTGIVIFQSDVAKSNASQHEPRGRIDSEGNYQLETAGKQGAPPGWYKVAVVCAKTPTSPKGRHAPPQWLIHPKYGNMETSGLALQVVEKPAVGSYDLKLTRKSPTR